MFTKEREGIFIPGTVTSNASTVSINEGEERFSHSAFPLSNSWVENTVPLNHWIGKKVFDRHENLFKETAR